MKSGGISTDLLHPSTVKPQQNWKRNNKTRFLFVHFCLCFVFVFGFRLPFRFLMLLLNFAHFAVTQVPRHKSKKGGVQKRVYFWGGISWWGKTTGVAWTAEDVKVCYRNTKNLCQGTLFEDEGVVYRVVETRAAGDDRNVSYVDHFQFPEDIPDERHWFVSSYDEVKTWHRLSRAILVQREDLQSPTCMQDTVKTLEIYNDVLYPALRRMRINSIVEARVTHTCNYV